MRDTGIISDEKPASLHQRGQLEKRQSICQNGSGVSHSLKSLPDSRSLGWAENDEHF